jgi:hypothetical protein
VLEVKINNKVIYTKTKDYNPLFYVGKEAIWFYWYGGNMNIDGGTHTHQHSNSSLDNIWVHTVWYPYYQDRPSSQFSANLSEDMNTGNWYEIYQKNAEIVNEFLEVYNTKVRDKTLTPKISKMLDEVDMWYNIMITIMRLGNMSGNLNTGIVYDNKYLLSKLASYE